MTIRYRSNLVCGITAVLFSALLFLVIPKQVGLETTVNFGIFFQRPICVVFMVLLVVLIVSLQKGNKKEKEQEAKAKAK